LWKKISTKKIFFFSPNLFLKKKFSAEKKNYLRYFLILMIFPLLEQIFSKAKKYFSRFEQGQNEKKIWHYPKRAHFR